MAKKRPWVYGRDPAPQNWHETADIIKDLQKKRKKLGRLDEIERLVKDNKGK